MAQSEEDILNSIGNELEDETSKKKAAAKVEKEYAALKTKASSYFKSKKYDKAKEYYNQMLGLKPESDYVISQLALIDEKIAAKKEAEKEQKYKALITQADGLLTNEKWEEAKLKYTSALTLKGDDAYCKSQLAKISSLKAASEKAAAEAVLQKKYDVVLATAETALAAKNWDVAKQKFEAAAAIKPNESYPKEKAAQVKLLKAAAIAQAKKAKLEKDYKLQLAKADQLFSTHKWDLAIKEYQVASGLIPNETYPKEQVKKANERIKIDAEKKAELARIETDFTKFKKLGEDALSQKNWILAIESFKTASALKPSNTDVLGLLNEAKSGKKASEESALREKAEAEALIKKQKQFDSEMAKGKQALLAKNWEVAREAFLKAKGLKPDETMPAEKLEELAILVETEKKEEADAKAKLAAEKEAEQLRLAEEARVAKEKAIAEKAAKEEAERIALKAKVEEEARIKEAKRLAAEAAKAAEEERLAKDAEEQAKKKEEARVAAIAAEKLKAEQEAIEREKKRLAKEKALAEKNKMEEEQKLATKAKAEADAARLKEAQLAKKKEAEEEQLELARKKKEFNQAVTEYKEAIKNSEWELALRALTAATAFFPENEKVIAMQSELIALQDAEKQAKIVAQQKVKKIKLEEEQYAKMLKEGDGALAKDDWKNAAEAYKKASSMRPDEEYPKNQLRITHQKEMEADATALEKQRKIDAEYKKLLEKGDENFNNEQWDDAKGYYLKAEKVKPTDDRAVKKRKAVDVKIELAKKLENEKLAVEKDYQERIRMGQVAIDNKKYAEAKRFFFGASKLKPNEQLPKDKLAEVESLWQAQVADEKIAAEKERKADLEAKFSAFMKAGNEEYKNEAYVKSVQSYRKALVLKPDDETAISQMNAVLKDKAISDANAEKEMLAEKERIRKAEKASQLAKMRADKEAKMAKDIDLAVNQGDAALAKNSLKEALSWYKKAVLLKPDDAELNAKLKSTQQKYLSENAVEIAKKKEESRLASIALKKRQEEAKIAREAYLEELNKYTPEELAKNYSDGITEEIETENELVVTKSIIVEEGLGRYLIRFDYPWGEHFYYLNGKKIRADAYNWNIRNYKF